MQATVQKYIDNSIALEGVLVDTYTSNLEPFIIDSAKFGDMGALKDYLSKNKKRMMLGIQSAMPVTKDYALFK